MRTTLDHVRTCSSLSPKCKDQQTLQKRSLRSISRLWCLVEDPIWKLPPKHPPTAHQSTAMESSKQQSELESLRGTFLAPPPHEGVVLPPHAHVPVVPVEEEQVPSKEDQESSHHPPPKREPSRNKSRLGGRSVRRLRRIFWDSKDNSPLARNHLTMPLPKFRLPALERYNGSRDLRTTYRPAWLW